MTRIRSFIAIEVPELVKSQLARNQETIRGNLPQTMAKSQGGGPIKWVNPEGIHLTLKFLGSVPQENIGTIEAAIKRAVDNQKPFELSLTGLGVFPGLARPRVIWVGVGGDGLNALALLQSAIDEEMTRLGFPKENREFSPHLTLGRVRETASSPDRRAIGEAVKTAAAPSGERFAVTEVSLMRSELSPRGARYSKIAAFPL